MCHNVSGRKLGRTTAHRRMLCRNLVTELFRHERITTTAPKAKEARALAERLITYAKKRHALALTERFDEAGLTARELAARRDAARYLTVPEVLRKLFSGIGPRYHERAGGYTRLLELDGPRKGDKRTWPSSSWSTRRSCRVSRTAPSASSGGVS